MKKIYYLASCSTCKRIIKTLELGEDFEFQNIKKHAITPEQLDEMKEMAGTYEALFSRRSGKFRPMGLAEMELSEQDYRQLILEEYTFLKRPVIIIGKEIFVGNHNQTVQAVAKALGA